MKRLPIPLCAAILILAGCGAESNSSYTAETTDAAEQPLTEDAMLRPDATNPVNESLEVPLGWQVRLDSADPDVVIGADTASADIWFVTMTPGWHITMKRPRAIFYHPASTAEGSYTISSRIHLFAPGQRNEGYGLIIGGQHLENDQQSYVYFLLRRSGEFLIKQRTGDETETLFGWEANDAIVPYTEETESTATNTLGVQVDDTTLTFFVNDVQVHSMEKADLQTDGIVGFRFNHGINVHVETFDVVQKS